MALLLCSGTSWAGLCSEPQCPHRKSPRAMWNCSQDACGSTTYRLVSESSWAEVIHLHSTQLELGSNISPPGPGFMVPGFTLNQTLIPNNIIHNSIGLMIRFLAWTPLVLVLIPFF